MVYGGKMNTYISRIELAKLIGVNKSTIDRWRNPKSKQYNPNFPSPIKIGRNTIFVRQEIEAYLEQCKQN